MRRAALALALAVTACASAPPARRAAGASDGDRTHDPRFEAARAAANPEFQSQADALAAGVYERFLPRDSIDVDGAAPVGGFATAADETTPPAAAAPPVGEDPDTEELIGTLDAAAPYNPRDADPSADASARPARAAEAARRTWTLQLGAFGNETGARVRVRQLEDDFPGVPAWSIESRGVWRVFLGHFSDRSAADRLRDEAVARGYSDVWTRPAP